MNSSGKAGSGIAPNPYAHLNKSPTQAERALNDPKHPINLPLGAAPAFEPSQGMQDSLQSGRVDSAVNKPNRFELFLLGDGEKKITEAPDTPQFFTILKEDHTLANMLRERLLKDPHVMFAGYRVPHPLFATFELRVMTDGELSPRDAIIGSAKALVSDLGLLSREFTKEFELRKMVQQDSENNGNDNERK